jgi:uroporphyrinogen-III decarboxylase
VFNLGHGILQTTPPHHVAELCEIVHGWKGSM